jgi:serine/threonine-protein kinase RsbW
LRVCVEEVSRRLQENAFFSKEWSLQSEIGTEKQAMADIAQILASSRPCCTRMEDMLTVVAEACLNAFEHGNRFDTAYEVRLRMVVSPTSVTFRVLDHGEGIKEEPASVRGVDQWSLSNPRGWGLRLIHELSDRVEFGRDEQDNCFYIEIEFKR